MKATALLAVVCCWQCTSGLGFIGWRLSELWVWGFRAGSGGQGLGSRARGLGCFISRELQSIWGLSQPGIYFMVMMRSFSVRMWCVVWDHLAMMRL